VPGVARLRVMKVAVGRINFRIAADPPGGSALDVEAKIGLPGPRHRSYLRACAQSPALGQIQPRPQDGLVSDNSIQHQLWGQAVQGSIEAEIELKRFRRIAR